MTHITPGNVISVNRNGSVAEAFYRPVPFCATEESTSLCAISTQSVEGDVLMRADTEREVSLRVWAEMGFRRMRTSRIKLPVDSRGLPDWEVHGSFCIVSRL